MAEEPATPKLIWEADSTHPDKASHIREALRQVVDPEIGLSVIELGLVRQVSIADGEARLKMILTTPFCPYGPALLEMARSKAEQASGLATRIELSPEMWDPSMMEEGAAAAWGFY
ncbi:MAG: metal-sulfur cluster assembly factor [Chloroflexota bacterium]